ncbi:Atrial natriuretic peptide receptor 1 [Orchesella cincta]|uniref:Guanylate cyclase n=1 Tax=Orchesella cincta TaxID=48709 RepID=A0A1D2MPH3_ORCCI|nr:Atrial natriuretic peptide receptor 1 [Orchesella cincta]
MGCTCQKVWLEFHHRHQPFTDFKSSPSMRYSTDVSSFAHKLFVSSDGAAVPDNSNGVKRYDESGSDSDNSVLGANSGSFRSFPVTKSQAKNFNNGGGNHRNRRSRHSTENLFSLNASNSISSTNTHIQTMRNISNSNFTNSNWSSSQTESSEESSEFRFHHHHHQPEKNRSGANMKFDHNKDMKNEETVSAEHNSIVIKLEGDEDDTMLLDMSSSQSISSFPRIEFDTSEFTHYNVGVLLVSGTGSSFDLEKCSPAVDMALDIVNQAYLRPHKIFLQKIQKSYSACDNSLTPGLAADMRFLSNVISFIGPACGFALEPVARLSAYWNIPVVTGLGDQGVFGDKTEFSTLTRLSYCQCRLKLVFDAICKRFEWKHLAVIYDKTDLFSFTVGRILVNGLNDAEYEVYGYQIDSTDLSEMDEALVAISPHARIVILSLQETLVREFMLKAHARGLTNGEWAFLDVELFKNKPSETNVWLKGDKNDLDAKAAYEALLTISLLMPRSPTWSNFSKSVKARALRDYNFTFPDDEEVSFFIGAFYDGVILLGMALNESLTAKESVLDGQQITSRMWNRTFEGVTGNVTIDANGDRDADYSILDMNPITGQFEVVAHYLSQQGLVFMTNRQIRWPGSGGPPSDIPECGFLGNDAKCRNQFGMIPYVGGVILVFAISIVAVLAFVYRHLREVEAASSTKWRILPEEISFESADNKPKGPVEEKESSRGSLSLGTGTGQTTFVQTASYRGVQVGLRRIPLVKRIEFTKHIVAEIRQGMSFLHSNCGPHGRLSSAKCLVDARFVVKISDFGLHALRSFQQKEPLDVDYFIKMLWVAPEHLPRPGNLERYSLKGDIYSFGIILYEVAYRALPYSVNNTLTPEEIVAKVASHSNPPFRPEFADDCGPLEIRQLMQNCWLDCADDRPDFGLVRTILKKMMKGAGTVSLVDDLLRRLEQHASHLEALVEDKTRELEQEKRRSEDLLYQVLPRQVAEQLLRGETVAPESFDAVTVYFSDIVGFTSICARSSPIQVVDFLNNLYGTFDGILDSFDAYKVETIGDAYLCVSGAPQRNDDRHVTEIAYLALAVLDAVTKYEIGHLPDEQLRIRIGIHTGPICAGVVGHRMPHYCLFGDTVNTASRMESSGLPLRIHITEKTAEGLEATGGFQLVPRGEVLLKGKGVTNTFWLMGCDDESKWKRARKLHAAASKESIDTKCSATVNHHYSHSPSNNIMTICVTPAE